MKTLLSPRHLAQAIGVSESTVKRWADDGLLKVARTAGGHRRIPMPEALRFIRQIKATIVRPDMLGMPELAESEPEVWSAGEPPLGDSLFNALVAGEVNRSRGLVVGSYLAGRSMVELCDGPIRESLHRLGELWHEDKRGVMIEHRAVDIIVQTLNQLRGLIPAPEPSANLALGGAAEFDPYLVPTLMNALVLADAGWRQINFGPHTPTHVLRHATEDYQPRLVWLSCSGLVPDAQVFAQEVAELGQWTQDRQATLIVGGRTRPCEGIAQTGYARQGQSMADLLKCADEIGSVNPTP